MPDSMMNPNPGYHSVTFNHRQLATNNCRVFPKKNSYIQYMCERGTGCENFVMNRNPGYLVSGGASWLQSIT